MALQPKGITTHPGVASVVTGDAQGADTKYWVFFKDGWGFMELGQPYSRDYWISGGCAIDSVAEFKELNLMLSPEGK